MKSIAITGSYASGKSFILNYLAKLGYPTFSCDEYIQKLYFIPKVREELLVLFREMEGIFDKNKLITIIYSDENKRKKLEEYFHPKVREEVIKFKQNYSEEDFVFAEVPLLFETGFNDYFDYSICVYCREEIRKKNAKKRGGGNLEIYNKIKDIQLPQEEKRALADFQINSAGDINLQIIKIFASLF